MHTIKKQTYASKKQTEPQIEGLLHTLSDLYERNRQMILTAVVAVLALLAAIGGWSLYRSSTESKASAMLARALESYSAGQPDYGRTVELLRDIEKKYSGTLSAAIAQYSLGNSLMGMGRAQEAVDAYRTFIKQYGDDKDLLGLVYQRMGYAYLDLGNREESVEAFESAEQLLGPGMATAELAKLYDQMGRKDEAKKKHALLVDKLPGTGLSAEAQKNLSKEAAATVPNQSGNNR